MFPDFLTHYYLRDSKPFLSISELSKEEWIALESKLADLDRFNCVRISGIIVVS